MLGRQIDVSFVWAIENSLFCSSALLDSQYVHEAMSARGEKHTTLTGLWFQHKAIWSMLSIGAELTDCISNQMWQTVDLSAFVIVIRKHNFVLNCNLTQQIESVLIQRLRYRVWIYKTRPVNNDHYIWSESRKAFTITNINTKAHRNHLFLFVLCQVFTQAKILLVKMSDTHYPNCCLSPLVFWSIILYVILCCSICCLCTCEYAQLYCLFGSSISSAPCLLQCMIFKQFYFRC